MITAQGITYQIEEGKTTACEDFSFQGGITYLPYAKKDIFSLLSLASVPFTSGSLSVDGVQLSPAGFVGGTAKGIKLDVAGMGSLFLVSFYNGAKEEANIAFQKLVHELKALKFHSKTEESKKDRVKILMTVLSLNPISYILIDLNDPLVQKNRVLWELAFLDYKGRVFFLSEDLEKAARTPTSEKLWSKSQLFLPYRIPLFFTSFSTVFLACYAQSLEINAFLRRGLVLAAAALFMIANIMIGIFFSKKTLTKETTKETLVSLELISAISNVIGIAGALLAVWLFSSKTTLFTDSIFSGSGLAVMTLISFFLLFIHFFVGHIVLASLFSKD